MAYGALFTLICNTCGDHVFCSSAVKAIEQACEYAADFHDWEYDEELDYDVCRTCGAKGWQQ